MPSTANLSVRGLTLAAMLMMLAAVFVMLAASVPAETQSLETLLAYLKSPNVSTRRDAARKLGERRVRNQLALEALVAAATKDDNPGVRQDAVNSLGLIKDFSALPEMLDSLKDIEPSVRGIAVRSLVALYTEHDIDFITNRRSGWNLFNPLLDTSDHEIIEPYILVDPKIIAALGESARGDRERDVRISAIRGLGVLRGGGAITQLAEALNADQDVRIEVLRAFIKIGDPAAGPHVVPFFADSEQNVRTQAMVAAGMLKYRPAVEPLIAGYRLGPEKKGSMKLMTDKVKGRFTYLPPRDEAALWALSLLADERAEQVFVENITSDDGDRRQHAVEGLARLAKAQYLDQISQLILKENDGDVRLADHWALYRMGSTPHLIYIIRKLDTDQAPQARGYLLESNPVDLYAHVHSNSKEIRQGVIEVLGRIGDAETVKELEPVVRTSSPATADAATVAIKRIEWRIAGRPRASDDVMQRPRRAANP
jgi:HEAT repeat protein